MNLKEQKRLLVLNRINERKLTGEQAAELLGWSVRHVWRMLARYRSEGAEALAHGNRGKKSQRRIPPGQRSRIVSLARGEYAGVNQQHLAELLADREQMAVSRSTLRRILSEAGIASPRRQRRRRRHRLRRERYPQEGMLVQIDGSRHDWLQGRGPRLTLLVGVDDATGKVVGAVFRPQEDSQGYFLLLRQIVEGYGRPMALYRDRHSIFQENTKKLSVEEQLQGRPAPSLVVSSMSWRFVPFRPGLLRPRDGLNGSSVLFRIASSPNSDSITCPRHKRLSSSSIHSSSPSTSASP